jgi:type II secretion system protein G
MEDTMMQSQRSEAGFTLVELMVVVAIIALLASIIIPNYVHARAQTAVSESEANIKQIATSLELYYGDNQAYPATGGGIVNPALFGGATNPYMTSTPTNAIERGTYAYTFVTVAGKPPSYQILDAGPYDPTTLTALQKGPGTGAMCGTAGCTQIVYDPQDGLYGQ